MCVLSKISKYIMANNAAMEHVCNTANSLFPELNVHLSELSQPTEAFLTRIFVHYLRAFGLRVDPPYNVDSKETSRERRQFLSKLCRQVERILQISFPGKTFTYIDIFEPTARKTTNTLDVLFNYYCFYKMHKKEVISSIVEKHKERQHLFTTISNKKKELGQSQQDAAQLKINIGKCEANIAQLREELPRAQAELQEQTKILRQKESESELQEQQLEELTSQVNQLKQLVVQDSNVAEVKQQTEEIVNRIEGAKVEMAKQKELFKERCREIEENQALNDEIEKTSKILPPEMLTAYKESLKQRERMEKKHISLEAKNQNLLAATEKQKQQLEHCKVELEQVKLNHEQEAQVAKHNIAKQESEIVQQAAQVEKWEQYKVELQEQIEEEELTTEHMKSFVTKLSSSNTRDI